jgi:hypothetical protein
MELQIIMLNGMSQTHRQILYIFSHVRKLDLKSKIDINEGTNWGQGTQG